MPSAEKLPSGHNGNRRRAQGTKRKLPRRPSPVPEASSRHQQSTVSEIFSSSSQSQTSPYKDQTSPRKRQKRSPSSDNMTSSMKRPCPSSSQKQVRSTRPDRHRKAGDLTSFDSTRLKAGTSAYHGSGRSSNFQAYGGTQKLGIKDLNQDAASTDDLLLGKTWTNLDGMLTAIFHNENVAGSLEDLYRSVESTCLQQGPKRLLDRLQFRSRENIQELVRDRLVHEAALGGGDIEILGAVLMSWKSWKEQSMALRSIFFYMDRSYFLSDTQPAVAEITTSQFQEEVFLNPKLKPSILRALSDSINQDRNGTRDASNRGTVRDAIQMMHDLVVYTSDFEPTFLSASRLYFSRRADHESTECDLAAYIGLCENFMRDEMERCDFFGLDPSTRRELLAMMEETLIRNKVELLVNTEQLFKILKSHAMGTLQSLYTLLQRTRLEKRLEAPWEAYIKCAGANIIHDEGREGDMVVRLLELKGKMDQIWKIAFRKNEKLGHLLREAFAFFINERRPGSSRNVHNAKPGEMIAKYIDSLLRGGLKAIPSRLISAGFTGAAGGENIEGVGVAVDDEDAELNNQLDHVLELFRFIEGKDVFEAFYKKDLARRLLMARSASADAERTMLAKLNTECGSAFTHNLEQMFKDVDLSKEEMASYKQSCNDRGITPQLDLSVNVLSSAAWPTYPDVTVNVPSEIMNVIEMYDQMYKSKHTGRNLNWKHALAHCVIKAKFRRGDKELVVSAFQAIVILFFNDLDEGVSLGYKEIQTSSGLSDSELKRTLQSLACGKFRVLSKEPRGRDVNDDDQFSVNENFWDSKYRIKINQIQLKETKEENQATHEDVSRDRQYEAQAAIVRIMKSRKTISAPELMVETINLTKNRGALETTEIKKQIDKLIEKDYLERVTEDGRMVYNYLA